MAPSVSASDETGELLVELYSEEIPARMQPRAAEDLLRMVTEGLASAGLRHGPAEAFATPRRLALVVRDLTLASPDQVEERRGPRVDAPRSALEGFLRATGLSPADLVVQEDRRGAYYSARITRPGRPAEEIVAEVLERVIRTFPWPKSMRWGSGSLRWVRPLRSILCLLVGAEGPKIVPFALAGLEAGNTTRGHRFLAPEPVAVTGFADYRTKLEKAFVILDPEQRKRIIQTEAEAQARAMGLSLVPDPALLTEVAGLVEWPVVLAGRLEERFLHLPPEVLRTSMREHQKTFALAEPSGRVVGFATVANRPTVDHGATILSGNRKVLAARLSDAAFFWETDLRTVAEIGLRGLADGLCAVTFHARLGSQAERVERLSALARDLAPQVGALPDLAGEAARVCKADLCSKMVGEFPELQGVMGAYYARAAGLPEAVARALREHYLPQGPTDDVPTAPVSVAVALADRIDTLLGFWAIDEKPTGSKDPFALRRAALGIIRLLLTNKHRLPLRPIFEKHLTRSGTAAFPASVAVPHALADDLLGFLHERLKVHLRDQGIRHDVIDAVLHMPGNDDLVLLVKRAEALAAFLATDDGENLLRGFRRANNILAQAEAEDGVSYSFGADPKLAESPAEATLFTALDQAEAAMTKALAGEDFVGAMRALSALRAPIDAFFDAVQVNAPNAILRRNRLNLLSRIRAICARVADLSRLEG